jgi:hypothetical protein
MDVPISDVADLLQEEHGIAVVVEGRTFRLPAPVKGDPGFAVLRVLGLVDTVSPVGAAAHGATGVAIGVWRRPDIYVARWTSGRRWVVGYRLAAGSEPNDYIRIEGRLPTRLETGNWYGAVPEEVEQAFLEADLLLDDPPFPIPPPPAASRSAAGSKASSASGSSSAPARAARPAPRSRPSTVRREAAPTTRLCPGCRMHKALAQFVTGSDRCVDCR